MANILATTTSTSDNSPIMPFPRASIIYPSLLERKAQEILETTSDSDAADTITANPHPQLTHFQTLLATFPPINRRYISLEVMPGDRARMFDGEPLAENSQEFPLFPKLPLELRLRIWKFTMVPRMVRFEPGGGKALGAMNANRESRREIRKHYRLCINYCDRPWATPVDVGQLEILPDFGFFINFKVDVAYISPLGRMRDHIGRIPLADLVGYPYIELALQRAKEEYTMWLSDVQRLAFDGKCFHGPTGSMIYTWRFLPQKFCVQYAALREILVILDNKMEPELENLLPADCGTTEEIGTMDCISGSFDRLYKEALVDSSKWWEHKVNLNFMRVDPTASSRRKTWVKRVMGW
ncbi:uncharacterized protein LY89DRAFT_673599 [Mollisia scopiformis]|uniref:2EXR domain-containing protein n=1 Tax=Mollisia scopiformis TaxID=149040 RepID=A0A194WXE6_MOLSC|nr:uncharacterized protein LY89DRAFT_673599 [Mollisia scopiformis]KUJ12651.1 hypothetical protein LY89DRAFT_673599 [Mollisia scopiformis]